MAKRKLTLKRASYYVRIQVYLSRREAIRKKHNFSFGSWTSNKSYTDAVKRINYKIDYWKLQIKKIDMLNNKIMAGFVF